MILAIHTALPQMSLTLVQDQKILDQAVYSGPTAKAEDLLIWVRNLLQKNNQTQKNIKAIGLCYGPGAFTGLRLAAMTAKTLSLALDIPLYGVGFFEGIAMQLQTQKIFGKVQISFHACRDQANNAVVESKPDRTYQIKTDLAVDEKNFFSNIPTVDFYVGEYPENLKIKALNLIPDATGTGLLAEQALIAKKPSELETLKILYSHEPNVRLSDKPELLRLRQ